MSASAGTTGTESAYSGTGFVVHEWGTDTIVVGSDGSLQRGLHHEEEDLPSFVYDRVKQGTLLGMAGPSPSVTIKMETPVTYFYSDHPIEVRARVAFPQGILTQWYPSVGSFLPPIAAPLSMAGQVPLGYGDPVLEVGFPFPFAKCRTRLPVLQGGSLDWGQISVLASGSDVSKAAPVAPLEQFGWSYARDVKSNPLETANGETEQFLFYRGLGDFTLPVLARALGEDKVELTNHYPEAVGQVFVLNVDQAHGAFTSHPAGIGSESTLATTAPSLQGAPSLDAYVDSLSVAVTAALDGAGLFHDEAKAMVNTWKRQWFRTPGLRVLYLIPQSWTDQSIPLTIEPKPDVTRRVMLIRVELITPEQERADQAAVLQLASDSGQGGTYFRALGRFAEPRLRRALSLSPSTLGSSYLATIQGIASTVESGE